FTDSVFTVRSTRGRMSIRTAVEREFLQMSLEILSQSTRKMMSVFSAVSKQVTFLAEAYFVRRLKGTSFTTALGAALIPPWPWQILAGTDYYWNPKFSTFIEYHYLNYTSTQIDTNQGRDLRQQLIGAGLRFHF